MVYLCMDCGQHDTFTATQNYTEWGTEDITINNEGEVIDWGDRDSNDSEITEGPLNIECPECGSINIESFDTEEELLDAQERILQSETDDTEILKNGKELLGD